MKDLFSPGINCSAISAVSDTGLLVNGDEVATYIHFKRLPVDDYFLSVGSANLNNRSMGLDTELNVVWQAPERQNDTQQSIRAMRVNLLAEHTGLEHESLIELARRQEPARYLDQISNDPHSRLRRYPLFSDVAKNQSWIETLFPDGLSLHPGESVFGEDSYEPIAPGLDTLFPKGLHWLSNLLSESIE